VVRAALPPDGKQGLKGRILQWKSTRLTESTNWRAKKSDGLTDEEAAEHAALRQEYIAGFRENMRQVLENTYVQRPDGTKTKLQKKTPTK
jgi:Bacterial protein of unknown function (DUF896)